MKSNNFLPDNLLLPNRHHEHWKFTNAESLLKKNTQFNKQKQNYNLSSIINSLPASFKGDILLFDGNSWLIAKGNEHWQLEDAKDTDDNYYFQEYIQDENIYKTQLQYSHGYQATALNNPKEVAFVIIQSKSSDVSTVSTPRIHINLEQQTAPLTIFELIIGHNQADHQSTIISSMTIDNPTSMITLHRIVNSTSVKLLRWLGITNSANLKYFQWLTELDCCKDFVTINLDNEDAVCDLNIVGNLKNSEQIDITTLVCHRKGKTNATQNFKIILNENAKAAVTGKIRINEQCAQSKSFFRSQHLLLSNTAHVYSQPQLEIYTDDVQCSHGSSTGLMQQEELFYLNSRGLNTEKSKALLLTAFISQALDQVEHDDHKQYFTKMISRSK